MQEALPYKRWEAQAPCLPRVAESNSVDSATLGVIKSENEGEIETVVKMVRDNPVIVIGKRGCCMCHVVRKLLLGLGVNPPIFEINYDVNESLLINSLISNNNNNVNVNSSNMQMQLPMVFVGGKFFGGLDKVMATHLSGDLVPILKQAGALWL